MITEVGEGMALRNFARRAAWSDAGRSTWGDFGTLLANQFEDVRVSNAAKASHFGALSVAR